MAVSFGGGDYLPLQLYAGARLQVLQLGAYQLRQHRCVACCGNRDVQLEDESTNLLFIVLRDLVKSGRSTIHHVPTQQMLADCAIKHPNAINLARSCTQIKDFSY